ncbi:hypothetical protein [Caldisericum sp.]|uniref:hypothetical protein n=1 Tax=Caldisericum sp. TaxID=2499687 RepID=UPI003D09AE07
MPGIEQFLIGLPISEITKETAEVLKTPAGQKMLEEQAKIWSSTAETSRDISKRIARLGEEYARVPLRAWEKKFGFLEDKIIPLSVLEKETVLDRKDRLLSLARKMKEDLAYDDLQNFLIHLDVFDKILNKETALIRKKYKIPTYPNSLGFVKMVEQIIAYLLQPEIKIDDVLKIISIVNKLKMYTSGITQKLRNKKKKRIEDYGGFLGAVLLF